TSQISDAFSRTRCEGQEESESGNQGQVVGQIEGFLGSEESWQEVNLVDLFSSGPAFPSAN
ncbi:MAG: hypothetical protein U1E51_13555, partial [Candidatus Binatia bacterium]|nr:hypothetical protein [Candidatus Binatia bacterium]